MYLTLNDTTTGIPFFMPDEDAPWIGVTGITSFTVKYRRTGDTAFQTLSSPTVTEVGDGWYELQPSSDMVNTAGFLVVQISAAGARTQHLMFQVAASSGGGADPATIASAVWSHSTRELTGFGTLASDTAGAVWSHSTRELTGFGTLATDTATAVWTASSTTNYGTDTMGEHVKSLSTPNIDTSAIASAVWSHSTRELTGFGTLATDTAAAVWSHSTRELTGFGTLPASVALAVWQSSTVTDYGTDTMGEALKTVASGGVDYPTMAAAVWSYSDRQLTAISTGLAKSVWDVLLSDIVTTDSIGVLLKTNVDAAVSSRSTLTAADVQSAMTAQGYTSARASNLDNLDAAVSSRLAASSYIAPDNTSIADIKAKTDQLQFTSGNVHAAAQVVADKSGYELSSAQVAGITSGVWQQAYSTDYGAGSMGEHVKALNNADVSAIAAGVWSHSSRTLTDFGTLTSDVASAVWSHTTRELTGYTSLPAQVALAVWQASSLTDYGSNSMGETLKTVASGGVDYPTMAAAVWSYSARTLTDITVGQAQKVWDVLLVNINTAGSVGELVKTNLDATVSSRSTLTSSDVQSALTSQGYTSARAANLDNLDVAVSSRLDASSYVAPANSDIAAIKAVTDQFTFTSGNVNARAAVVADKTGYSLTAAANSDIAMAVWQSSTTTYYGANSMGESLKTVSSGGVDYGALAAAVWSHTDRQLTAFSTGLAKSVWDVLTSDVAVSSSMGELVKTNLDVAVSTRLAASSYVAPANSDIAAIKAKTDLLSFSSGHVLARAVVVDDKSGYSLDAGGASSIASAVMAATVEGSFNLQQWLRLMGAVTFGRRAVSGATHTYFGVDNTTARVVGTVDASNNRTISTRNGA